MPTLRQTIASSIARHYPFLSGCGTVANSKLVRLIAGKESDDLTWTRLDNGAEILVALNDYAGRAAFYVGELDRKVSEVIKRIVRPKDTVLDIGANIGFVTLYLARVVGEEGTVHSFEPNPRICDRLIQSIERNGMKNVRVHKCALGAVEDVCNLHIPMHNSGEGTLKNTGLNDSWKSVQVQVRTLSKLAEEFDFDNVRLVKMDVEGYESEVLSGAHDWLSAHPPDAIIFESNGIHAAGEPNSVISRLVEKDYILYAVPKRFFSLKLRRFDPAIAQASTTHDMLAIRRNCEREIISNFSVET